MKQGDHAEFNQCQAQLLLLYDDGIQVPLIYIKQWAQHLITVILILYFFHKSSFNCCILCKIKSITHTKQGNTDEFTAYHILYNVFSGNHTANTTILLELTDAQRKNTAIKHALQVRSAQALSDYHKLFKLYMVRCIVLHQIAWKRTIHHCHLQ